MAQTVTDPSPPRCAFVMPSGKVCGLKIFYSVHLLNLNRWWDQSCTIHELHHVFVPPAEQEGTPK